MPSLNLSLFLQTNNLSEIMADAEIGKNDILVKEELIGLGPEMGSNESNGSMRRSSEIIGDDTTKVHNLLFFSNFLFALKLFKGLALSLWSKLDQTCLILQIDFNFFLSCFGF